jgi:hypothetical protein
MSASSLDKPLRFTPDFWVAFAVLAIPTLWLSQPWLWNLPMISKLAGVVFLPFAAVIVCYCPVMFAMAVLRGGREERRSASAGLGAVAGAAVFLGVVWIVYGFDRLPSFLAIPAVLIANLIYAGVGPKRSPNKTPLPPPGECPPPGAADL